MSFLDFLNTLENTLNSISVVGKENVSLLDGCFSAINSMRESLINTIQQELAKPSGGEDIGRQSDIGTDTSNDSNDK